MTSQYHFDLSTATEQLGNIEKEVNRLEIENKALKDGKAKAEWKAKDSQRELTELDIQLIELKNQLTEQSSFEYLKIQVAGNLLFHLL